MHSQFDSWQQHWYCRITSRWNEILLQSSKWIFGELLEEVMFISMSANPIGDKSGMIYFQYFAANSGRQASSLLFSGTILLVLYVRWYEKSSRTQYVCDNINCKRQHEKLLFSFTFTFYETKSLSSLSFWYY